MKTHHKEVGLVAQRCKKGRLPPEASQAVNQHDPGILQHQSKVASGWAPKRQPMHPAWMQRCFGLHSAPPGWPYLAALPTCTHSSDAWGHVHTQQALWHRGTEAGWSHHRLEVPQSHVLSQGGGQLALPVSRVTELPWCST